VIDALIIMINVLARLIICTCRTVYTPCLKKE